MSPIDLRDPRTRALMTIVATVGLVVACSGNAPSAAAPSDGPAAAATPRSASGPSVAAPGAAAGDAWLVVGRSGEDGLEAIAGSTSQRLFGLPSGVPDATWSQLISATTTGETTTGETTTVRDLRIPELEGMSQTVEGAWRLPTIGLDPTPVGVSDDGRTIVLVEDRAAPPDGYAATGQSRFAIVDRTAAAAPRIVDLAGAFEYDALSPDGSILYVVEHLAGPPDGHYQVRALDTATGVLRDGAVADKTEGDEAMAGTPIAQERRPDGMVFTLYHGAEHPFIHALSSVDAWALCIDLPATAADDATAINDWGLAATADSRALLAANATLGLAVEIPLSDLAVRRSVTFEPSASREVSLAKFGHQAGGPVGRRVVVSPLGSVVYAAGPGGIVGIGISDLAITGRFLGGVAVDALAVTPDGGTIYALLHAGGRIVWLDAASGRIVGEVPGGGYDRLVAVVPM